MAYIITLHHLPAWSQVTLSLVGAEKCGLIIFTPVKHTPIGSHNYLCKNNGKAAAAASLSLYGAAHHNASLCSAAFYKGYSSVYDKSFFLRGTLLSCKVQNLNIKQIVQVRIPNFWTRGAGMAQWGEHSPSANVARSRCHMWVEFVVGSRPCSEGFFLVFLPL